MMHEYLVIAECECGQRVRFTRSFTDPVPVDHDIVITWQYCPHCGREHPEFDLIAEYEIFRRQTIFVLHCLECEQTIEGEAVPDDRVCPDCRTDNVTTWTYDPI